MKLSQATMKSYHFSLPLRAYSFLTDPKMAIPSQFSEVVPEGPASDDETEWDAPEPIDYGSHDIVNILDDLTKFHSFFMELLEEKTALFIKVEGKAVIDTKNFVMDHKITLFHDVVLAIKMSCRLPSPEELTSDSVDIEFRTWVKVDPTKEFKVVVHQGKAIGLLISHKTKTYASLDSGTQRAIR